MPGAWILGVILVAGIAYALQTFNPRVRKWVIAKGPNGFLWLCGYTYLTIAGTFYGMFGLVLLYGYLTGKI